MIKLKTILEKLGYTEGEIKERLANAKEVQFVGKELQNTIDFSDIKTIRFDENGNEVEITPDELNLIF